MKNVLLGGLLFSAACGPVSELDRQGEPAPQGLHDPHGVPGTVAQALLGTDCGALVPSKDGAFELSEISHLEAIDASGCSYFSGNVRVAFTVPLVPSSQRYLFQLKNVVAVTGTITQHNTTQSVGFTGLESVARIEVRKGGVCHYGALKHASSLALQQDCSFPALESVGILTMDGVTAITGFAKLQRATGISLASSGALDIKGFKALTRVDGIELKVATNKITGSFPVLETVDLLTITDADLTSFSLPKLTTVTNSLTQTKCREAPRPFKVIQTIGSWSLKEVTGSLGFVGPSTLTTLGSLHFDVGVTRLEVRGFSNLKAITGAIVGRGSGTLRLSDFDELTSLGGVSIITNYLGMEGFSKVAVIDGPLTIRTWQDSVFTDDQFSAFSGLTEVKGPVDLNLDNPTNGAFPLLKTVGGDLGFKEQNQPSRTVNAFPKLETVAGSLIVKNNARSFAALKRVDKTLKILEVPGSLPYKPIDGFQKLTFVGGDLAFDKNAYRLHTQRLLDRLVGFTGTITLE